MRHVYFRGIMGLVWLTAAIAGVLHGNFGSTVFYLLPGTAFLYSAYAAWKKENDDKGGM